MTREHLLKLRELIRRAAPSLSDADASLGPELFPRLSYDGSLVEFGTRIFWKGKIKVAASALWDREENDPDHAPTLWDDLDYRDGIRIIPETISYAKKFSAGERGWWGNAIYRSLVNDNVYTPAQYAANWEKEE